MNNYSAIGRVGRDAEVRTTEGGDKVLNCSLAVDSGFGAKKQTLWFDLSLWGKRADSLVAFLKKGVQIGVSGELGTREHKEKTYLTLRVQDVSLLGGKAAAAQG